MKTRGIDWNTITGIAVSSVVPNATTSFQRMASKYLRLEAVVVSASLELGLKISYDPPSAVGADRICNAVGGFVKYGGPLVLVDFGTATTFDVITADAEYLGGIIAPGIQTTANALHQVAALLPKVEYKFPEKIIASNTEASLQAGLMYGTVDMIDGMIHRIAAEFDQPVKMVATGGLAKVVVPKLKTVKKIEPFLTLDGLRIIFERVKGSKL